jgi:hypothetical protein
MTGRKRGEYEEPFSLDMDPDEALERFAQTDPAEADALAKEADAGQFPEAEPLDTGDRLLPYIGKNGAQVDLIVGGDSFWASQAQMAEMFGVHRSVVSKHLKNIFEEGELDPDSVSAKIAHTAGDGKTYQVSIFNLNALISVAYRVGSKPGTLFRMWATDKLVQYLTKGFVMDDERLKNPKGGQPDYFDELLDRIRDIRSSEQRMWMRVLEFAEFCSDYDKNSETQGNEFFAEIQNTMHWAVLGMTAPELIRDRVDASKPNAGVVTFKGKLPTVKNAQTAKDLLHEPEIKSLNHITSLVLEFFESQVEQRRMTTLAQFVAKMRELVKLDGRPVKPPGHAGKISRPAADKWASDQIRAYKARMKVEAEQNGEQTLRKIAAAVKALPKK